MSKFKAKMGFHDSRIGRCEQGDIVDNPPEDLVTNGYLKPYKTKVVDQKPEVVTEPKVEDKPKVEDVPKADEVPVVETPKTVKKPVKKTTKKTAKKTAKKTTKK